MAQTELIGVREASRRLSLHENTVRKLVERGELRAVRLPGSGFKRFRPEDIERMRAEMFSAFPDESYQPKDSDAKSTGKVAKEDYF